MAKSGIISVIPKNFDHAFPTMEKSLREKGLSMFPGTFKMLFPYREKSGKRRTGLDPNALYIQNIKDQDARLAEINRVTKLRQELEQKSGYDLSPDSKFWNDIAPYKLQDGDNFFDADNVEQQIAFAWLKVHPTIAKSLQAYSAGDYPPDTHFYVKDTDAESEISYNKKRLINDAIKKMDAFSLEKRRKVARLVGLPTSEDTKEEIVYNDLDTFIRSEAIKSGPYAGQNGAHVFNSIAELDDNLIAIKDTVETALNKKLYREGKGGRIMEGETVRWNSKAEMLKFFVDEENQLDLLELEQRIKGKEILA